MLNLRMESYRMRFVALVLVGLISLPLRAGVIPGRWEKVLVLAVASPITVELKEGDRIKGHYGGLSDTDLTLVNGSSRTVIPKEDIEAITIQPKDDLLNGAFIGAASGGLILGAVSAKRGFDYNARGQLYLVAIGAAIGLGIGALADAASKPVATELYRAPEISSR